MLKFSANIGLLFTELPFRERFEAAKIAGFDAVEFPFPKEFSAKEIRRHLDNSEMIQSLANMPYEMTDLGLAASPGQETIFQERLSQSIHYAKETGCLILHVLAGKTPAGTSRNDSEVVLCNNLRYAAALAGDAGLTVVIEAINRHDVPEFSIESVHHAAEIVESLGVSNLCLLLDLYHAAKMGEDMVAIAQRYSPLAGYVQLAGFKHRNEPNDGAADYAQLLNQISKSGYDGYFGCEYLPIADTESGLSWISDVKQKLC